MHNIARPLVCGVFLGLALWLPAAAAESPTIRQIQDRNVVRCGINSYAGYGLRGPDGRWQGFMVDFCRATAAAVLGNKDLFEVIPIEASSRFAALRGGQIDVLYDGTTKTLERDLMKGFSFGPIYLYDGQGFLAHQGLGITTVAEAAGLKVCVVDGTTSLFNLQEYLGRTGIALEPLVLKSDQGAWEAFARHRCDLISNDRNGLMARRGALGNDAERMVLLADIISREPLAPLMRSDDEEWRKLVFWLVQGLVLAEDLGITRAGVVDGWATVTNAESAVLLGQTEDYAEALGVQPGWMRRAIAAVGNYGEIFARHLGADSAIGMQRGPNALWRNGGLMYAPVVR